MFVLRSELNEAVFQIILLSHQNFRAGGHFVLERAMDMKSEDRFNFFKFWSCL